MRSHVMFAVAAGALMLSGLPAGAQDFGADGSFYVAARGGASRASDVELRELAGDGQPGFPGFDNEIDFDTGYRGSLAVGHNLGDFPIRPVFEIGYTNADVDELTVQGSAQDSSVLNGDIDSISFMGNLYYDFEIDRSTDFYLGGGIGISELRANFSGTGIFSPGFGNVFNPADDEDTVFSYQLMAGLAWHVSDRASLDVGYRLFSSEDPSYSFGAMEAPIIQTIEAGVRFRF